MSILYWVRHGENPANLTKEFSCRKINYSLTPKGVLQAEQTAEFFAGKPIQAIYTSPLKRACETAEVIASRLGLKTAVMENFREVDVGDMEGQPVQPQMWRLHDEILAGWLTDRPERYFPGGENCLEAWERARTGIIEILTARADQHIMVVSHGAILAVTLKYLCPEFDLSQIRKIQNNNCSITEIELDLQAGQPRGRVATWASTTHLSGEAAKLVSPLPDHETFKSS